MAAVRVLDRVRRLNRDYLNPVVRRIAGRVPGPLILLRHRGRTSGRMYLTPLIAQRTQVGYVIPLTYGSRTDWAKNVLASGKAQIRQGNRDSALSKPEVIDRETALPLLSPWLRLAVRLVPLRRFLTLVDSQSRAALSA
jgi:deazaflavin-dependent oxidoreductase (nitroreductase family)